MSKMGQEFLRICETDEFKEGFDACYESQLAKHINPYPASDIDERHHNWNLGWDAARLMEQDSD